MSRPLPDISDPEFAPFWAGAAAGELRLVFCSACGHPRWPPRPLCPDCQSFDFEWRQVVPRGRLYTWTVVEHQTTPGVPAPYIVGLVELDEYPGVRLLGQVTADPSRPLFVGTPMTARFDRVAEAVTLVNWTPSDAETQESKT